MREVRDLYTTQEVADIFRVSTKTVARWRQAGKLEAVQLPGGQYRFPEKSVKALLNKES
jgi:excisionase family DNA binding protein